MRWCWRKVLPLMRILYFAYVELDTPSACQTHTLGVLRGLAVNGCHVDAVVPRPLLDLEEIPSVRFTYLSRYRGKRRYRLRDIPHSTLLLIALCLRHRYDAIYARDMDVFIGPRLCSQLFRLPLFLEIDDTPIEGQYPGIVRAIVKVNLKWDYKVSAGLIVPSVPRCRLIREDFGISPDKIHMILNGTELWTGNFPDRASVRSSLRLPLDSFCLGYVGTLTDRYDFPTLLKAMARCREEVPQLRLIVVGGGPEASRIEQQAQALNLEDRILMTGFLPQNAFPMVLPAMDVGLMTLTQEAVQEHGPIHTKLGTYGTFRLPVVTAGYSLDGYPSEIREGVLLVPPGDDKALAEALVFLHRNPAERVRIATRLQDFVVRRLTWEAVTADILTIMRMP
jgi:glycosyltransferase involved in cell wall biosynthesis